MWRTTVVFPLVILLLAFFTAPIGAQLQVAGELVVDLDAADPTAGTDVWENKATGAGASDFDKVDMVGDGYPMLEEVKGVPCVTFLGGSNSTPVAYRSQGEAPASVVGPDSTKSIEVWAYNSWYRGGGFPNDEDYFDGRHRMGRDETMISWSRRGNPGIDGGMMSFNYGDHEFFGAVVQWSDAFDIPWTAGDVTGDTAPDDLDALVCPLKRANNVPEADKWHHLVYTYDGMTGRLYVDGCLTAEMCELAFKNASGVDTQAGFPFNLGAQTRGAGDQAADFRQFARDLQIARVRVHTDVLDEAQVVNNYELERGEFEFADCEGCPAAGRAFPGMTYAVGPLVFSSSAGDSTVTVIEPAGATLVDGILSYDVPGDEVVGETIDVIIELDVGGETAQISWELLVSVVAARDIEVAEYLIVELDIGDIDDCAWENTADDPVGMFVVVGGEADAPIEENVVGVDAVTFAGTNDLPQVFRSELPAPPSITGNGTRTIEVWAYQPEGEIGNEETMVSWSRRGGPDGSNMGFQWGAHDERGAAGHWGGDFDIPWGPNGTATPAGGRWHHLVYTYDGTDVRLYDDGQQVHQVSVALDSAGGFPINVGAQVRNEENPNDFRSHFGGSIARVRVHAGVLTPEQVASNYETEVSEFQQACACPDCPTEDLAFAGAPYIRDLTFTSIPPVSGVAVVEPAGATITPEGHLVVDVPVDSGDFMVTVECTNPLLGTESFSWMVSVVELPNLGEIQVAGNLLVDLHAEDDSAGTAVWENRGTLMDFTEGSIPAVAEDIAGAPAVTFSGEEGVYYQCLEDAPESITGSGPRTIEVWVLNPDVSGEEAMVGWSWRGGPDCSHNAFQYGAHDERGAFAGWGDDCDLPWGDQGSAVPAPGFWHHLAYTYDGFTSRLYRDGEEVLVRDTALMTKFGSPITLGAQIANDGPLPALPTTREASLSIGQVRVHDDALDALQVATNFATEAGCYGLSSRRCGGGVPFHRGDADDNGALELTDAVRIFGFLFLGEAAPTCLDAADADNNAALEITDAIRILGFLFLGGPPPADPGPPGAGAVCDSDDDEALGCVSYTKC